MSTELLFNSVKLKLLQTNMKLKRILNRYLVNNLCYSLDLEWSPEIQVLKGWPQPVGLLGGGGIFKRWGLVEGS
jgi:hypothetical protein